jgi:hypothetical protein
MSGITMMPAIIDRIISDPSQPADFKEVVKCAKAIRLQKSVKDRCRLIDSVHKSGNEIINISLFELLLVGGDAPLRYQPGMEAA